MIRGLSLVLAVGGIAFATVSNAQTAIPEPESRVGVGTASRTVQLEVSDRFALVDQRCAAQPVDAALRQRMVDIAVREWRRFRYPVVDYTRSGLTQVIVPDRAPLIAQRLNRIRTGIVPRLMRVGVMEDEERVRRAIAGYWATTPGGEGIVQRQNNIWSLYGSAGWAEPWSAAFISYVMCSSGLSSPEQFRRSPAHRHYVDQAIQRADGSAQAQEAAYRARDIGTGLPAPGDLLCADRDEDQSSWYASIADRRPQLTGPRDMHCDLVVHVDRAGRYAALIGGNVLNAVTMTLVNITGTGAAAQIERSAGGRPWFALLELQAPGQGHLAAAPDLPGPCNRRGATCATLP